MNLKEHLLVCVSEELSEVAFCAMRGAQAAAKGLRFGLDDGYPQTERTNVGDLIREVNDLLGALELLQESGVELPGLYDRVQIDAKKRRIQHWASHAKARGTLTE